MLKKFIPALDPAHLHAGCVVSYNDELMINVAQRHTDTDVRRRFVNILNELEIPVYFKGIQFSPCATAHKQKRAAPCEPGSFFCERLSSGY